MPKSKITLKNNKKRRFPALFLTLYLAAIFYGQEINHELNREPLNFGKPFIRCPGLTENNERLIFASDNNIAIFLTNDGANIVSYNLDKKNTNWKTDSGGKINLKSGNSGKKLFVIANHQSDSLMFNLKSLSLNTGIIEWQKKLSGDAEIQSVTDDIIILRNKDNSFSGVSAIDGKTLWNTSFRDIPRSVEVIGGSDLRIISDYNVTDLVLANGEIIRQIKIKANLITAAVSSKNYLVYGNSTGEIVNILLENQTSRPKIIWKTKTGGSITSLVKTTGGILVSSLDNFLYLFNELNGSLIWKKRLGGRILHKPLISEDYVIAVNSGESIASVLSLSEGKLLNQIEIEENVYFTGSPFTSANLLLFPTNRGVFVYSNLPC